MALKLPVAILDVSNLTDARYGAGMGVDYLGFCLDPESPQYVAPDKIKEITSWLSGVSFLGCWGDTSADEINSISDTLGLHYALVNHPVARVAEIKLPLVVNLGTLSTIDLTQLLGLISLYPQDTSFLVYLDDNTSEAELVPKLQLFYNLLKYNRLWVFPQSNGLDTQALVRLLNQSCLVLSADTGAEIRPGYKDLSMISNWLEALEVEEL